MTALSFGFTKLVVSDLDALELFYCSVFGMQAMHRVSAGEHAYALDEVILALPGAPAAHSLIITRYRHRPCPPSGAAWTGFVVTDLAATLAAIESSGGAIEVPAHENAEHGVLAAIASDPEGHLIEVIQMIAAG